MEMIKSIGLILLVMQVNYLFAQTPLDEEFTYQGSLQTSNNPANGQFDFKFVLFDAELDGTGNNLGQVNVEDLEVENSQFTTKLNFGAASFVGNKVWMEISIREGSSTGGYQLLLPRQQITAAPYATHAQFVGVDAITDLEISANAVGISEINASQVQSRISQACGDGFYIKSVNQDGSVVCAADDSGLTTVTSAEITNNTIQAIDIDATQIQQRVTGTCVFGEYLREVQQDGSVICAADDAGLTTVTSADIDDNTIQSVDLGVSIVGSSAIIQSQVQTRVIGSCIYPEYVTNISENGDLICARAPVGISYLLDGNSGIHSSIAIGADNNPIISLDNNGNLRVIKCSNQSCSSFNTPITLDFNGANSSIAIGADNNPIISYHDKNNQDLKIIKCANQSCTTINQAVVLDTRGVESSIAIGADNNPIISYLDDLNLNLNIVQCTNQSCTGFNAPVTIATTGFIGFGSNIVIGADTNPIISSSDNLNSIFYTVKCTTPSCSSFNAPVNFDPGFFSDSPASIAIGADDNPIISTYDYNLGNLRVIKCTNQDCSSLNAPVLIDTIGLVGEDPSIAIGADSNPVVSYHDNTNKNLKLVRCNTQSCSRFNAPITLDSIGEVGRYSNIAIGADGNPIISYYDSINSDLKVYSCGDLTCSK
jgi:hypothetical protein